jgi:hypothetical protein
MQPAFPADPLPPAVDSDVAQPGAAVSAEPVRDHPCQICPNCGSKLNAFRCKLICACCGYFMSCADYY